MRVFLFCFSFVFCASLMKAQTDQPVNVYRILSNIYSSKSMDEIKEAYSLNAVLINLYQKSEPHMIVGLEDINNYYANFFKGFAENGQNLELIFKIIDRRFVNEKLYDSGYYELIISDASGNVQKYHGKFNTILVQENGRWIIQNDATTDNIEAEAFERVESKFSY